MEKEEGELTMIPIVIALLVLPLLFGRDDDDGKPSISDKYAALYRLDDEYYPDRMGGGGGDDEEYRRRRYY